MFKMEVSLSEPLEPVHAESLWSGPIFLDSSSCHSDPVTNQMWVLSAGLLLDSCITLLLFYFPESQCPVYRMGSIIYGSVRNELLL